jgi:Sec7-like guanine-nucleotide exchange factor
MLATDLHNANVKTKMTRDQWVKNNSGCNNGKDFDVNWLKKIYDRIAKAPLDRPTSMQKSSSNQVPLHPPKSFAYVMPANLASQYRTSHDNKIGKQIRITCFPIVEACYYQEQCGLDGPLKKITMNATAAYNPSKEINRNYSSM